MDAVNAGIAQLQTQVSSGAVADADAAALMDAYPRTVFDEENNTVSVVFKVSPDVENAVAKTNAISHNRGAAPVLSEKEETALTIYNGYIQNFKAYVGDWEAVVYDASAEDAQIIMDEATEWRPGRSIFVVNTIIDNQIYGSQ